ncbi:MAG: ornithine cyclodeaminase family protein [Planctomycetota bacterium]|nr:ornithine cyclodeaminase family protein [Planctomycetota bacterium]
MSSPQVITLEQIRTALDSIDVCSVMEEAFIAHSNGRSVVPPVGELLIKREPPGEVHLKYGYLEGGSHYVVKIASGFPGNPGIGLPPGNGLMILFDLSTGGISGILLDEGHLTDVRTAGAGALASRVLGVPGSRIGIVGTGVQARLQAVHHALANGSSEFMVWGRDPGRTSALASELGDSGLDVEVAPSIEVLADHCRTIVTCTASSRPLLDASMIRPGTHVTAIGSDTPAKQELDPDVLAAADLVVTDCLEQSRLRGEVARSLESGAIAHDRVLELGRILDRTAIGRTDPDQRTVVDLTGVAVQDLLIAEAVLRHL